MTRSESPRKPATSSSDRGGNSAAHYRRQLEAVTRNATLALFIMDERQHCTYMNPAAERLTGYTVAEVQGRALHDVVHHTRPDGTPYPLEKCPIDRAFPENQREQGEEVFVHRNGSFYPVAFTASPILEDGRPVGTILEVRDIREEREVRREAEKASAVLSAFFEAAPIPATLIDRELRFQRINRALATFYGRSPEEVVGKSLADVVPTYADKVEPYYRAVLETGEPIRDLEVSIPSSTDPGQERHFLVNYFPVRVGTGEVIFVGALGVDVTERQRMDQAEREQSTLVETVQRVGRSVASELDLEKIVQEVTDAATEVTGAQFGAFFYNVVSEAGESYTLYTISGAPREAFSAFPMPRNTPVFGPTFHGTGVVRSDDITEDPRYGQVAPFHGMPEGHLPVTSYLAVPVISRNGEVLGGLFFGHGEPGRFTESHERLAEGIAGWAAVAMDNARLFAAAHHARAEAERANQVKSQFLAVMSHELRTPLNAMIGYARLLEEGIPEPIPVEAQRKVERIGLSARHLLELIDEILTFSRLEVGEEKVEREEVEPAELIDELECLMEPLALEKEIGFVCRSPIKPRPIMSDRRKVLQILINLVGNAIKFTEEGKVELVATQVGDEMVFQVRDTGPGIEPEDLERIFEPFWQADAGTTRTAGGTGLGLSVARRLARLLGGDLTSESEVGKGSLFVVRLPMR